jgi:alpha-tubulin suppressor-like RCC1 family protein
MVLVVCLSLAGEGSMKAAAEAKRPHVGRGSVAAGRAHSVIAAPDGRVMTWGAGNRGQLGDGTLLNRSTPVTVAGLDNVVAVAAGAAHTVAVTTTGDVYTWGANTFGRLGDGTHTRRVRPVRVRGLSSVTMVAAGRAHTLALTTSGAVYAWGRNTSGQLGTGNKVASVAPVKVAGLANIVAIAAGDNHSLAVSRDGRLFAWGDNQFSMLGDGTTKDRDRPVAVGLTDVVAVAGGASHSLALRRDGSVYSWGHGTHGALGTGSNRNATTPKLVSGLSARAIAAGRQFSGAIRSDGKVAMWGLNESGQLGDHTTVSRNRPVIVDALDAVEALALGDAHALAVTINGDVRAWGEGDFGRLGTGTAADQTAPLEIVSDVPDWGTAPGEEPEPPEPPDTTPPTITISTSPALHDGWMTTPVTVAFQCADETALASCPSPVIVATDGVQQVTGVAVDAAGNRTAATLAVKIDRNPPSLSIAAAQDQRVTTDSEMTIAGSAIDAASGIGDARCNGEPATLVDGVVSCTIALRPGRNDIVLHAIDLAGHNASAAITVTRVGVPAALMVTPATRTLEVDEVARLALRDEYGAEVRDATWTTSASTVVALSTDDPPVITATALGTATITAEKDGMSAHATVTVSPGLAPGDARWTVPPTPEFFSQPPLFTNRVAPDVPAMFTVETQAWGDARLRAIDVDGQVMWQQDAGGIPIMGDSFGGAIVGVLADVNSGTDYRAYKRIGGGSTPPWRYESNGALSRPAQARDGTLYAIEYLFGGLDIDGYEVWDKYATVMDGATGRVISRTVLPREVDEFTSLRDGDVIPLTPPIQCRSYRYDGSPSTIGPIVGSDGRGYLLVRRYRLHKTADCIEPFQRRPDRTVEMGLDLMILSPAAAPQVVSVYSSSCAGTLGTTLPCDLPVRAFQMMPDAIGGMLVTFERGTQMVGDSVFVQSSMTRVPEAGGDNIERNVSPGFWLQMVGQDGVAVTYGDEGWQAIDVKSGDVKWAGLPADLMPLAARPDGGLAGLDMTTGELKILGASATVERTQPFGLEWTAFHESEDWVGLRNNEVVSLVGEFANATRFNWSNGNGQGQLTPREPGIGVFAKTHLAEELPADLARFRHVSIRVVPRNWQHWVEAGVELKGTDDFGNGFFTLGAGLANGDTSLLCSGTLVSNLNRLADYTVPARDPLESLPFPPALEESIIQSLLDKDAAYRDDLPYACFPEQFYNRGFYNSNSYAHGLVNAVGLPLPRLPERFPGLMPGWMTPIPLSKFQ